VTQLLQRKCVVIVGPPDAALRIEDLRVRFTVHKDSSIKPNTAEVRITNLSPSSRKRVQNRGDPLIIQAGYEGTISTLFSGRIRTSDNVREGPDWTTLIRSGDGENAYAFASISTSFRAGTSKSAVLTALGNALANFVTDPIDVRDALNTFSGISGSVRQNLVCHGKVVDYLDPILRQAGYEWSIQGGRLQVLKVGDTTAQAAFELSPTSGMIGSAEHGAGDGKFPEAKASIIKVRCLLEPQIQPGRKISLVSASVTGILRVIEGDYIGDTGGGQAWHNELQAKPAPGSVVQ